MTDFMLNPMAVSFNHASHENTCLRTGRLKISESAVRRLVNPNHPSRTEKVEAALEALGKRAILEAA